MIGSVGVLKFGDLGAQAVSRRIYGPVDAEADLEGIGEHDRADGMTAIVLADGKPWYFDKDSEAAAVSGSVRAPTVGTGRWLVGVPNIPALGVSTAMLAAGSVTTAKLAAGAVDAAALGALAVTTAKINTAAVTAAKQGVVEADGLAPTLTLRKAFTALVTGAADDVSIYAANAPFAFRILDAFVMVATGVAASTGTLRSATGGGGSALSDAFDTETTGVKRNAAITATPTVAANGTLVFRRSDRAIAGEIIITIAKE